VANIQTPRGENAVDLETGSFKSYWTAFFGILAKRLNAATATAAVISPDAAAAPGAYSQAHIQTIVAEVNELKQQLNALLTALNT
jgi:hypothetical protein